MSILFLPAILILLYGLEQIVFKRTWYRGLSSALSFQCTPVTEGDTAVLTEVITNRSWVPLPVLQVNFRLDKGLRVLGEENASVSDYTNMTELFSLQPWQQVTRELRIDCTRRGYYRIVGNSLIAGDLLAPRTHYVTAQQNTGLYVYPRMIDGRQPEVPYTFLMGEVRSRRLLYEEPFAFRGIRDYSPTDPMVRINWKASARTGDLKVNLRDYTVGQQVLILLNVEEPLLHYLQVILEDSIRWALTLAARLLEEQIPVGVLSNGRDVVSCSSLRVEPGSGPGHLRRICEGLARIDLDQDPEDFAPYLEREVLSEDSAASGSAGGLTYVLISSSRRDGTIRSVRKLSARQNPLVWICPITSDMDRTPIEGDGIEMFVEIHAGR